MRGRWYWFYENGFILAGKVIDNSIGDEVVTLLATVAGKTRVYRRRKLWLYATLQKAERDLCRA